MSIGGAKFFIPRPRDEKYWFTGYPMDGSDSQPVIAAFENGKNLKVIAPASFKEKWGEEVLSHHFIEVSQVYKAAKVISHRTYIQLVCNVRPDIPKPQGLR